jgi:hypothetical protein
MEEEKKTHKGDDSINMLLEQALTRKREEMMENFSQILQRRPIYNAHPHQKTTFELPLLQGTG